MMQQEYHRSRPETNHSQELLWTGLAEFFIAPSAFIDALRFDCLASGELVVGTVDGERSGFGKSTSMLEFVEQLTHRRGDVDRRSLINALRKAARK